MITKADFKTERFDGPNTVEVRTSVQISRRPYLVRSTVAEGQLAERIGAMRADSRESIATHVYGDIHEDLKDILRKTVEQDVPEIEELLERLIARTDPANFR